jgi:1-acyl-sn-glycerol-3-phosphate acyltransferase
MKKLISALASIIFYIFFGLSLLLFLFFQIIALNLFGYKAHKWVVDFLNLIIIIELKFILGVNYSLINFKNLPKDRPLIFIANHQSTYDVPPIIWYLRKYHVKFVAKKELIKFIPSISYNLKHGGSVLIDRSNPEEAKKAIQNFGKYIHNHCYSVSIFPEGTRSKTAEIKPFKVGGVKTLLENIPNALIVPLAIKGSWKVSRYGGWIKSIGEKISIEMLPSVEYKGEETKVFVLKLQKMIQKKLNNDSVNQ